ncbi:MAG: hypothetical protein HZA50_02040 [Planctomycetes bacterium]|nr:hypothetical protein [Planctomycetota bacterium]
MQMSVELNSRWPVLKIYDQNHLRRIAMPLGGIGTGTVSLGGRGNLQDWELGNRPAKGFTPGSGAFFALWTRADGQTKTRALEGLVPIGEFEGQSGCWAPNHGLPRFRSCKFAAAYPLAQVLLGDLDMPLDVRIEAFNPFIPPGADDSGIPVAVLRYVLVNKTGLPVQASVCGSMPNYIGQDGTTAPDKEAKVLNRNSFRKRGGLQGIFMESTGLDVWSEAWGTMALTTTAKAGVTYRTAWEEMRWNVPILDFWDDFSADGALEDREHKKERFPNCSLAVKVVVPPRSSRSVTFLLTWYYPNRRTWNKVPPRFKGHYRRNGRTCPDQHVVGNYYTSRYRDAWDAAARTAPRLVELEEGTVKFVKAFCGSDLPAVVKEAALFNASTLRTQTCFRTPDGKFFTWEGCHDKNGCCNGSCTHVWNYEQATAFLFGPLSRSMRTVEFAHATGSDGMMSFRVNLPLGVPSWKAAAADGQMGCLMKLYRDWKLSGDNTMLKTLWPNAKKALEFCWLKGSWDADKDGVMEGCQHNTMDVEYFGPNPEINVWYLGALRAGEEMASRMGDEKFAQVCRKLFDSGSRWMDRHLFNGRYYEHRIVPIKNSRSVLKCLILKMGAHDLASPDFQVGKGCLADQLVGQYMAHICGLGYLLDREKVHTTFRSIMKFNFRKNLFGHFNNMRSYALNDEQALLVCTYPLGKRPLRPNPYFLEAWTGMEYTAAVGMMQEGLVGDGLKVFTAVRDRHDGRKRNPFDEPECGHHYGRAMSSWAAVPTLTGFRYDGGRGVIEFAPAIGKGRRDFWSTGDAYGTCTQKKTARGVEVALEVIRGRLKLAQIVLAGFGSTKLAAKSVLHAGDSAKVVVWKN